MGILGSPPPFHRVPARTCLCRHGAGTKSYGKAWGFQYESIRYFVDCIADGVRPEVTGRDGLVVTAMIEATLKSLAEKRPIRMDEVLGTEGQAPGARDQGAGR